MKILKLEIAQPLGGSVEGVEWRIEREEEANSEKVAGANPGGSRGSQEGVWFMSK